MSKLVKVVVDLGRALNYFSIAVAPSIPKINRDHLNMLFTAISVILIMCLLRRKDIDVSSVLGRYICLGLPCSCCRGSFTVYSEEQQVSMTD